ncbi:MAG: DNA translocase FtsK 4TM domain-containing protein [Oscillospiraceae bacterium]
MTKEDGLGRMATKKTVTTAKKNNTTKKRKTAGSNYKTAYEQHQKSVRQISAIVMFTIGVLLFTIEIIPGSGVWQWCKVALYGLFGITALVIPVALIYIAIMATLDKPIGEIKHKIWQTGVLVALICGLVEIGTKFPYSGQNFWGSIAMLFNNGGKLKGGGVFSAIFGWPLLAMCGKTGAIIIIVLFLFAFIMLLTGTTLIGFFKSVAKPVKKIEEGYTQMREAQEIKNQNKFDIDVNLGPESVLPQHPVSSPKPSVEDLIELERQQTLENNRCIEEAEKAIAANKVEKKSDDKKLTDNLVEEALGQEVEGEKLNHDGFIEVEEPIVDSVDQIKLYTDANNVVNKYVYPPISFLKPPKTNVNRDVSEDQRQNGELLVDTLKSFGVQTKIINISRGPTVTRYELQPSAGVKISKITGLADDIAMNLAAAGVRIEAPIPNKAAVGIEVPNKITDIVTMREMIESRDFANAQSKISIALGRDIAGNCIVADVGKMPHMLIAGATGSGKSVCINSIIMSLLYKSSPSEVRFLMIDPKVVELGVYNGIPHLLVPVVTDPRKAAGALGWAVTEMLNRYKLFADNNVRDLQSFNVLAQEKEEIDPMPQIVIIIDELADLMMAAPNEVEDSICRLAQMARAAGMHLIIATQRPSVDIITGVIKANIPSRIAFAVSSQVDSRTILDGAGAEKLIGRGDMLYYPVGMPKPLRIQGCYVSDKEIEQVVNFVKNKEPADYDDKIIEEIEKQAVPEKGAAKDSGGGFNDSDELMPNAIECVIEAGQASTSYLQRKLKVGYARAARLIDEMEEKGIVGGFEGSKPRQVLFSRQQWIEMKMQKEE